MITLNLLPSGEKEILRQGKIYNLIIFYGQLFAAVLFVLAVLLLTLLSFLNIQVDIIEETGMLEISTPTGKAIEDLRSEITVVNQRLAIIDKIQQQQKLSPAILSDLSEMAPTGIQFFNFFYDNKTQKVVLDGRAATRENFLFFKSSLENYPKISNVDSPLSNLTKPTENNFRLSFIIK